MTSPEPVLPETRERRCPSCQSEKIVHAGYVVGGGGTIRSEQRCEGCGIAFWFVRTRMRQPNGVLTGLFFICYAIFRIVVENFREPDATLIAGFTRGQFFSFFLIAIGLAFVIVAKLRPTFPKKIAARD